MIKTSKRNDVTEVLSPLVDIRSRLINLAKVEMFTVEAAEPHYWRYDRTHPLRRHHVVGVRRHPEDGHRDRLPRSAETRTTCCSACASPR